MRVFVLALAAALWSGVCFAADQPGYGPPPDWVKPQAIPTPKLDQGGATELLLNDQQLKVDATGIESYQHFAFKILQPEALMGAGNLAFNWRPDTMTLTINHIRVVRDGQVIDLLGHGEKFTVLRREENLEMAMLDGTLTAAFQPPGLQVGDILDIAVTEKISDPVLNGHVEDLTGNMTTGSPDRLFLRALWPSNMPVRWRMGEGLPKPKVTDSKNGHELLVDAHDVQELKAPEKAPPRFAELGYFEFTDFASWGDIAHLVAPYYEKAAVLRPDSPLKAEIEKIRAASTDPRARAAAALRLVQDQVRYVFLGMNDGGYVPASADDTWARRFGDCKAKSVLLVTILRELGIEAEPAAASVGRHDGLNAHYPLINLFDHVIVRAVIDGKTYWLDGARSGDRSLDDQPALLYGWALPLRTGAVDLEKLAPYTSTKPEISQTLRIDASAGLDAPAPASARNVYRGDSATMMRLSLQRVGAADRDAVLRKYWKSAYSWIEPKTVGFTPDEASGEVTLTMDGSAKMDWAQYTGDVRRYETDGTALGWKSNLKRDGGPHPDAPYAVDYPDYSEMTEIIVLPNKGKEFTVIGKDHDDKVGVWRLSRSASIRDGVFTAHAATQALASEITADAAAASAAPLKKLWDDDLYVQASAAYRPTDADVATLEGQTPATADEMLARAWTYMRRHEYAKAIPDLTEVIKLDPSNSLAFADRGISYFWTQNYTGAADDADKALALDPRQPIAYNIRGLLAVQNKEEQKAIDAFSRSHDLWPADGFALIARARLYVERKDYNHALADTDELLKLDPANPVALWIRAEAYQELGRYADALSAADAYLAVAPDKGDAHLQRANALLMLNRRDEAKEEFDRALAIEPSAAAYIGHAQTAYTADHRDKAIAEVDEALKLEPDMPGALLLRANMLILNKQPEKALADIDKLLAQNPNDQDAIDQQIKALMALHRPDAVLEVVHKLPPPAPTDAEGLNNRCWLRAIVNRELDRALADCDAAIKQDPKAAAILDSRAFVHLRRGELDAAIGDYDEALKLKPDLSDSLFGRGIAKLQKGLTAEGRADLAAARKRRPGIDEDFASYGVKPDGATAP